MSKTLDFRTQISRVQATTGTHDSCLVVIEIISKSGTIPTQKICYVSGLLFEDVYQRCSVVRSYTTGENQAAAVVDNDPGDLVVADFNFDGRDDFAAKCDSGGNGGPLYRFYVQRPDGRFVLDDFLTHEVLFFPTTIAPGRRTLTTLVHAGAHGLGKTTYQLDTKTNQWRQTSHRVLNVR